jgi:hypothetical protein
MNHTSAPAISSSSTSGLSMSRVNVGLPIAFAMMRQRETLKSL